MITIDVNECGLPTQVFYRGGVHSFELEADALAFVARRLADRPNLQVEVRVR
jgi:hypothetical protein